MNRSARIGRFTRGVAVLLVALGAAACSPDAATELARAKQLLAAQPPQAAAALPHLRAAAQAGNAAAAYHLGLLLRRGAPGVPRDLPAARRWLQAAADHRLPDAQFMLGQMLREGEGGRADAARARQLFELAGEQDQPEANLELAMAYQRGDLGVQPDADKAARYMMEAQHSLKDRPPAP